MKQEKPYQEEAIDDLLYQARGCLDRDRQNTIVFQSPTGSGKTYMMTRFIGALARETEKPVCFLWVSIGAGNLYEHSFRSVKKEIDPAVQCSLLEDEFFGSRDSIREKELVFLNWEKIRNKRDGKFTNVLMKEKDEYNFPEVLENTRTKGIRIILIIDECHRSAGTPRALELRDEIIRPFLTIEMSATPGFLKEGAGVTIQVPPQKVIDAGMIKKEVIINKDLEQIIDDEIHSERLVLESAYRKREEIRQEFERIHARVNPLMLIQLPNADAGEEKKESVLRFLREKGVPDDRIAIWLSEEKINSEEELLNKNTSSVDFLLFKQAIDTGWDCPRAHVLVKFRETSSVTFEIQTVGRILRMPEARSYDNELLDAAYVYTNIQSIIIKKEEYQPNILKNLTSRRISGYQDISLPSYYRNRVDFGDITGHFGLFYEKAFCLFFDIEQADRAAGKMPDCEACREKMAAKGIEFDTKRLDSIIHDLTIHAQDIDRGQRIDMADTLHITYSDSDLQQAYEAVLARNFHGFAPKRSMGNVKQAVIKTFRLYLGISPAGGGIEMMQRIVVANQAVFSRIISDAVLEFRRFKEEEIKRKTEGRWNEEWQIPLSRNYNPEMVREIPASLSVMQPLYLPLNGKKEPDMLEVDFIRYLETKKESVLWFWKNGDEHMESNFGIRREDGRTFQPDFIVRFRDGRTGIFDTKDVSHNKEDHVQKSDALYKYIAEGRYEGKDLVGGIVVRDQSGQFWYYMQPQYKGFDEEPQMWKRMEDLFTH